MIDCLMGDFQNGSTNNAYSDDENDDDKNEYGKTMGKQMMIIKEVVWYFFERNVGLKTKLIHGSRTS